MQRICPLHQIDFGKRGAAWRCGQFAFLRGSSQIRAALRCFSSRTRSEKPHRNAKYAYLCATRWFGLLEVVEGPFINNTPIFVPENDPDVVRFRVQTGVWLDITPRFTPMKRSTMFALLPAGHYEDIREENSVTELVARRQPQFGFPAVLPPEIP
jgi:hypothetical protein